MEKRCNEAESERYLNVDFVESNARKTKKKTQTRAFRPAFCLVPPENEKVQDVQEIVQIRFKEERSLT